MGAVSSHILHGHWLLELRPVALFEPKVAKLRVAARLPQPEEWLREALQRALRGRAVPRAARARRAQRRLRLADALAVLLAVEVALDGGEAELVRHRRVRG